MYNFTLFSLITQPPIFTSFINPLCFVHPFFMINRQGRNLPIQMGWRNILNSPEVYLPLCCFDAKNSTIFPQALFFILKMILVMVPSNFWPAYIRHFDENMQISPGIFLIYPVLVTRKLKGYGLVKYGLIFLSSE